MLQVPISETRLCKALRYAQSIAQFRLYGVKFGHGLRASRVILWNKGEIAIGNDTYLRSYPEGTGYPCSLRTYFPDARIEIGDNCVLNGAVLHSNCLISIGNRVMLGPGVVLVDNDSHAPVRSDERYTARAPQAPIRLGNRSWIGMRAIVMKGVTVGENTIVAAGSVVTRNLPENVLAAGSPAKAIRALPEDLHHLNNLRSASMT